MARYNFNRFEDSGVETCHCRIPLPPPPLSFLASFSASAMESLNSSSEPISPSNCLAMAPVSSKIPVLTIVNLMVLFEVEEEERWWMRKGKGRERRTKAENLINLGLQ